MSVLRCLPLLFLSSLGCKSKGDKEPSATREPTAPPKAQPAEADSPVKAAETAGDKGHEEMAKRALAFLAEKDSDGFVEALLFSGEEAGKMIRLGLAECPERAKGESVDKAVEAFTTMLAESVVPARERFSGCANAHDFAAATFVRVEPRGAETVCGINSLDSLGVVLNIAGEEKEFFRLDDPALVEGAWKTPEGLRCD